MAQDLRTARRAEHTVARWTTSLLFACLLLEAGTLASAYSYRAALRVAAAEPLLAGDMVANDARRPAIATLRPAALLITGIVWLVWLRRAYRNLALVGSKRSRFTARQAVGYWFIPFVNLARGYQVMRDLWLRSESMNDRDAYDDLPAPAFLSTWWGMSWTWGVLEPVVAATARGARTPLELINATDVGMLVNAAGVVAAVLAIKLVREIDRRQQCFAVSPALHPGGATQRGVTASARPQAGPSD